MIPARFLLLCCALLAAAPGAAAGWFHWKQQAPGGHGSGAREIIPLNVPLTWESTAKGTIDLNGKPIHIKGINWNGMELPEPIISGLEHRRMNDLLDILAQRNFNAIRVPLSYDVIQHMDQPRHGVNRNYVDQELRGKTLFQVLDVFMTEAGKRGLLIMFDLHQIDPIKGFDPLWYSNKASEADVNRALSNVLGRYKRSWNFFALDLKNEPHGDASWGSSDPKTDFNHYAERTIVQLNQEHPDWTGLYVVEGVGNHTDADYKSPWKQWWGADMQGVFKHPINTGDTDLNNRLVYSPRIYGPDVYDMEYFSDPAFPERLFEVWDSQFAWLERTTGRAAIMGEWGGSLEDKDRVIQENLKVWMAKRCLDDNFWWVYNPGSTDIPDGVMKSDWETIDDEKVALIDYVQPTPTKIYYNKVNLEVVRGAPRHAECADGPSDAIRPTPLPSAAPNTYRADPFAGMPPGTTSQDIRRMRREQKQKQGTTGAGGTGTDGGHRPHA